MAQVKSRIDAERQRVVSLGLSPAFIVLSLSNLRLLIDEMRGVGQSEEMLSSGKVDNLTIVVVNGSDIIEAAPALSDVSELLKQSGARRDVETQDIPPWPPRFK